MSPRPKRHIKRKQKGGIKKHPVKIARNEDLETSLCFLLNTEEESRWYKINVNDVTGDTPLHLSTTSLLCHQSCKDLPYGFTSLPLNSKLYLIGGTEHEPGTKSIPSSRVHIFDMNNRKWEVGTRMLGGKAFPMVADVDGKIYVFGQSLHRSDADPWAEVYDPVSDQWDDLPYPPNSTFLRDSPGQCVLHEQEKKVLVNFDGNQFYYFDTKSKLWALHENIIPDDILFYGKPVILHNHLFFFDLPQKTLYAYDLAGGSQLVPVPGLQEYTDSIHIYWDSFYFGAPEATDQTFLTNIGDGQLCLVWSFPMLNHHSKKILQIRCLKFRLQKSSAGFSAVVDGCNSYFTEDALDCIDCFTIPILTRSSTVTAKPQLNVMAPMRCSLLSPPFTLRKHDTISDMDPVTDTEPRDAEDISHALQGSQQIVQTTNGDAQVTRNARRVYVEGFFSDTAVQLLKKDIERFFNAVTTYSEPAAPVVSVYFNEERKFAIVEMRSEKEARDALELDLPFQGCRLKIRRPTDYNGEVASWAA